MTRLRSIAVVAAFVIAISASGIEVCRFPAGDRLNPFARWLSSQEVTCAPAESEIPAGTWNVFLRSPDGISTTPLLMEGGQAVPQSLWLATPATLSVSLPPGRTAVAWAPNSGSAFPLNGPTFVPAKEELWLIVLDKRTPVGVAKISPIEERATRTVDASEANGRALLTWVRVPVRDRDLIAHAHVDQPVVRPKSEPLPSLSLLDGAFVLIRGVAAGEIELEIGGPWWLTQRRKVKVESQPLTVITDPLTAFPAAAITVDWNAGQDLAALDRSFGACDDHDDEPPRFELVLLSCGESQERSGCQPFHHENLPLGETSGSYVARDVVPGYYRAELRYGKLPPFGTTVYAKPLQTNRTSFTAFYLKPYGDLTLGGKPLGKPASLRFRTGGVGFASQEKSEYHAVVPSAIPADSPVDVASCDDSVQATVLTDRWTWGRDRLDLDIPDNALTIRVTDTFTQSAIGGATVRMIVMGRRGPAMQRTYSTDSEGMLQIPYVPPRTIRLVIRAPHYESTEQTFSISSDEKKEVDVQLVPLRGGHGRIASARRFEAGTIAWYSADGAEIESAEVGGDGVFAYRKPHHANETMVVVSHSHPLWIAHSPELDPSDTPELTFPVAPVREVTITAHPFALVINGMRVPDSALERHQRLRRSSEESIGDLLATGPIEVVP